MLLGLNGVSEAFVHAVFVSSKFGRINTGLMLSSAVFAAGVRPLVSHYGTAGVVLANSAAMVVRVAWNLVHVHWAFESPVDYLGFGSRIGHQLEGGDGTATKASSSAAVADMGGVLSWARMLVHPTLGPTLAACVSLCYASSHRYAASAGALTHALQHIGTGATLFAMFMWVLYATQGVALKVHTAALISRRPQLTTSLSVLL